VIADPQRWCGLLPMASGPVDQFPIPRGSEVSITTRSQCALAGARLFVRDAAGWLLTSCTVGSRQILARHASIEPGGLEIGSVAVAEEVRVFARYDGDLDRAAFLGFVLGETSPPTAGMGRIARASSSAVGREWVRLEGSRQEGDAVELSVHFAGDADVLVHSIACAHAGDWLVEDVRFDHRALTVQSGYLPAIALGLPQEMDFALGVVTHVLTVKALPARTDPRVLLVEAEVSRMPPGGES